MRQLAKVEQVSYCAHQICSSGQHLLGCLYPEAVIFIDLFSLLFCLFLVVCLFACFVCLFVCLLVLFVCLFVYLFWCVPSSLALFFDQVSGI